MEAYNHTNAGCRTAVLTFLDAWTRQLKAPYMTSAVWPVASRSKQYAGNRTVKVGGISLNIDADWVASAVARG